MRKVLFVHDEKHFDRALRDALCLLSYGRKRMSRYESLDLLGVIVTPCSDDLILRSTLDGENTSQWSGFTGPLSHESVSINGIWNMLTISPSDPADSVDRHVALSRILGFFKSRLDASLIHAVFPTISSDESAQSIEELRAYLEQEHPGLPIRFPIVTDLSSPLRLEPIPIRLKTALMQ